MRGTNAICRPLRQGQAADKRSDHSVNLADYFAMRLPANTDSNLRGTSAPNSLETSVVAADSGPTFPSPANNPPSPRVSPRPLWAAASASSVSRDSLPRHRRLSPLPHGPGTRDTASAAAPTDHTDAALDVVNVTDPPNQLDMELQALTIWENAGSPEEAFQREMVADQFRLAWNNPATTELFLDDIETISSLPSLPPQLVIFSAIDCEALRVPPDSSRCTELGYFFMSGCRRLAEPPDFQHNARLTIATLEGCDVLEQPPNLRHCSALTRIDIKGGRRLTEFPDLSANVLLTHVDFSGARRVLRAPDFSANRRLQYLDLNRCVRMEVGPVLSDHAELTRLKIDRCHRLSEQSNLTGCPNLKILSMRSTPMRCPPLITGLRALHLLDLGESDQLGSAPDWRTCTALKHINLAGSRGITSLPPVGHLQQLEGLLVENCPLTGLPEDWMALPETCHLLITASHFSDTLRNRLDAVVNTANYHGPRIAYDLADPFEREVVPIVQAVQRWRAEASEMEPQTVALDWDRFTGDENVTAFADFLGRIRETSDYKQTILDPTLGESLQSCMQRRVISLLDTLQADAVLRATCFHLASDAINTCGDRVALRMIDMETVCHDAQLRSAIDRGAYDQQPQGIVDACKGLYRLQVLADLTEQKIKTLNWCDPIEVRLGYLVAFAGKYNLPVQLATMLYPAMSKLSEADLQAADELLSNLGDSASEQRQRSYEHFLTSSPPILAILARLFPADLQRANQRISSEIRQAEQNSHAALEALDLTVGGSDDRARQIAIQLDETRSAVRHEAVMPLLQQLASLHAIDLEL